MTGHDLIVVGASSGGVPVLRQLVAGLPAGLPAAICVVVHVPVTARSNLPEILSRAGPLLARHPTADEPLYPGHIYVAPPDYHLLVKAGEIVLDHGPRENGHRPAIDPLFRSAARAYGRRVVAVILTGGSSDGAAGLLAVRAAGGIAVVQDPAEATATSMPLAASQVAGADYLVPSTQLASLLVELVHRPIDAEGGPIVTPTHDDFELTIRRDLEARARGPRDGEVSALTCPECGGALWQKTENDLLLFSCHVGHRYAGDALFEEQNNALEAALWTSVRTFREKWMLALQLADRMRKEGKPESAERFEEDARLAEKYGDVIQQYLLRSPDSPSPPD